MPPERLSGSKERAPQNLKGRFIPWGVVQKAGREGLGDHTEKKKRREGTQMPGFTGFGGGGRGGTDPLWVGE